MAAKKKATVNKGGRPRAVIDYATLEELCAIGCTGEECAAVLRVSYDTIDRHLKQDGHISFAEFYKKHSATGCVSLRRTQLRMALEGSVPLLIWLGKQRLGQSEPKDRQDDGDEKVATPVNITINAVDASNR